CYCNLCRRSQPATAAGLPRAIFHMLRHTHANHLLSAGEPVTSVSRRLGHKNPAITLQVYSHVLEGMDDAAAGKTDQIMNAILYG
ncbi:MAG: tyrosine-type recombinase/integrase, partial [Dehalococcoidia bacterium]|nr:tyrosine-type recombinase/integrase [Dehalococcoidia bacterium]